MPRGRAQAPETGRTQAPETGRTQAPETGRTQAPETGRTQAPETGRAEPGTSVPERSRRRTGPGGLGAAEAARHAARQVAALTGREPEAVVAIERAEPGWRIAVEVVESRRVPDSADILAMYETELDGGGELVSYRRVRRYSRGRMYEEPR